MLFYTKNNYQMYSIYCFLPNRTNNVAKN